MLIICESVNENAASNSNRNGSSMVGFANSRSDQHSPSIDPAQIDNPYDADLDSTDSTDIPSSSLHARTRREILKKTMLTVLVFSDKA